jgi:hypothetical protein
MTPENETYTVVGDKIKNKKLKIQNTKYKIQNTKPENFRVLYRVPV